MPRRPALPFVALFAAVSVALLHAPASLATPRAPVLLASVMTTDSPRVAVLDFGDSATARRAADGLAAALRSISAALSPLDRSQSRAAARGFGYKGSLNLSLEEARDLGAAVGCDFLIAGEADTLRRSPGGSRPDYFESYASVFVVSSFTGRLVFWERLSATAATAGAAESDLLGRLRERAASYAELIARARAAERDARRTAVERDTPVVEDAPDEGTAAAKNFRVPLPYRRLRPAYTPEAARSEVEATVDALVELDERGEVLNVEIVRWAGYGLDESVAATIRRMHFRPALRDGSPVATRVLLRYNFRKPKEE